MRMVWPALAALMVVACSNERPPEKTVFDPYVQAVQKARSVEGAVAQAADERRKEAERAERPAD